MQINLESSAKNTIQAYSEEALKIANIDYDSSLLINAGELINPWPVHRLEELTLELLLESLHSKPKIIIIGHKQPKQFVGVALVENLAKQQIGLESMSIGAACRTFNVLINEAREVLLAIIL